MELQIDQEILAQADLCQYGHRCLQDPSGPLSEPEIQVLGNQRFICTVSGLCGYSVPFGSNFFCGCPVRRAVFDKYGK